MEKHTISHPLQIFFGWKAVTVSASLFFASFSVSIFHCHQTFSLSLIIFANELKVDAAREPRCKRSSPPCQNELVFRAIAADAAFNATALTDGVLAM